MTRTITRFALAALVAAGVALGLSASAAHAGRPICRPVPVEQVVDGQFCHPHGTGPGTSSTTVPEEETTTSTTSTSVVSDPAEAHLPDASAPVPVVIVPAYTG